MLGIELPRIKGVWSWDVNLANSKIDCGTLISSAGCVEDSCLLMGQQLEHARCQGNLSPVGWVEQRIIRVRTTVP